MNNDSIQTLKSNSSLQPKLPPRNIDGPNQLDNRKLSNTDIKNNTESKDPSISAHNLDNVNSKFQNLERKVSAFKLISPIISKEHLYLDGVEITEKFIPTLRNTVDPSSLNITNTAHTSPAIQRELINLINTAKNNEFSKQENNKINNSNNFNLNVASKNVDNLESKAKPGIFQPDPETMDESVFKPTLRDPLSNSKNNINKNISDIHPLLPNSPDTPRQSLSNSVSADKKSVNNSKPNNKKTKRLVRSNMTTAHKIIMAGAGGVGKSALTLQFMYGEFIEDYEPTKADSYRKNYELDNEVRIIDILDTAGQEDFMAIRDVYYRSGEGFMLVFSVSDIDSFNHIEECRESITRIKDDQNPPMLLVGNKCDLTTRQVSTEKAQEYAAKINVPYVETSAKNNLHVNKIFEDLTRALLERRKNQVDVNDSRPNNPNKKKRRKFKCTLL